MNPYRDPAMGIEIGHRALAGLMTAADWGEILGRVLLEGEVSRNDPIYARDGYRCAYQVPGVCLGRAMGTDHRIHGNRADRRPSNLISACGSGTTGCHGWKEAHPAEAAALGWTITSLVWVDTTQEPVYLRHPVYGAGWYLLDDDPVSPGLNRTEAP